MAKQQVQTEQAPRPGGPYSQGILAGGFLFVAGQGPTDPRTGKHAGDDIRTQTRQTLENVKAIVEAAGGSLSHAVKVNAYLSDLANFGGQASGQNYVSIAPGFRYKFSEFLQLGVYTEFGLVGSDDLNRFRVGVDLIWRY